MLILLAFAFLSGIVTILSPCILPILPIVLSSSVSEGKKRPFGIVLGFVASFTFFTLFLSAIVKATGLPAESLRIFSVIVIGLFGLSMLSTKTQIIIEQLFSKLASKLPVVQTKSGFLGGLLMGLSLGLIWTPCVGPILASVISLSFLGSVTAETFLITLAYSLGTAIPMFIIIYSGQSLFKKVPALTQNLKNIQKAFGLVMIAVALSIYFNVDRAFQTWVLTTFPNYGTGLTQFEDNNMIKNYINQLTNPQESISAKLSSEKDMSKLSDKTLRAPELIVGGQWINSQPLKLSELRGKVVLVDFWTYTCINCIRTLPYLRIWDQKYKDRGLVIIGVHTPEFEFEKDTANVQKAVSDFDLKYPVMQDNDFATWKAYANRYWPAKYFVDKDGYIRYTHFGEGDYEESEKIIQELLNEAGSETGDIQLTTDTYDIEARTPELYLGYKRIQYLASPEEIEKGKKATYSMPAKLYPNTFAYTGDWTVSDEQARPHNGTLILNFEAKDVFLVMRPTEKAKGEGKSGKVKVYLDNYLVGEAMAGEDVNTADGTVTIDADKLYKLIKLTTGGKHQLKLEFLDENVEIFAFTFG